VHVGDLTRVRAHEGTLRIGDRVVFGRDAAINCYLDVEIGAATMVADWVYVGDFDHRFEEQALAAGQSPPDRPIKDQGLVKSPIRIGPGSWLGVRSTVLRGTTMGPGCVLAAHSVARGDYPEGAVIAGVPGRVVRDRFAPAPATTPSRPSRRSRPSRPSRASRTPDVGEVTVDSPGA
jgi:acetyltransferase-like isoleucine patch superfamily enzyme